MHLASDEIRLTLDGTTVELRPTLRAALRLARRHGDYMTALRHIGDGHLSTIINTIEEGATDKEAARAFLDELDENPLMPAINLIRPVLFSFVMALAFTGETQGEAEASNATPVAKPISAIELNERLFAIGTGVLGWTPSETWNATPAEIVAANASRIDLLKAIFGPGDTTKDAGAPKDDRHLSEKVKTLFAGRRVKANDHAE